MMVGSILARRSSTTEWISDAGILSWEQRLKVLLFGYCHWTRQGGSAARPPEP